MQWQRLWLSGVMLCCGNVGAQEVLASPGARVRITTRASPRWVTGIVREVGRDSVRIDAGPVIGRDFATADLAELQVSLGRNHVAGMGVGLLVGAGLGGATGAVIWLRELRGTDSFIGPGHLAILFGVYGGAAGALLGGLVGTERWHPGVLSAVRIAPGPSGGIGVRLPLPR